MVNVHAVALFKALEAGTLLHDDAAGFMPGDDAVLISLGPFAGVCAVDGADVRAADRGSLGFYQHPIVEKILLLCIKLHKWDIKLYVILL